MKKITIMLLCCLGLSATAFSQEATNSGNTGDNFSLEGALALFKAAKNLEEFEKAINDENNNANNLDLNGDGKTDYISVDDIKDGDIHVLVLSTSLNETEKQDIATIGIEKTGADTATLQIEGDSDLYAENTIIEPYDTVDTTVKSKGGPDVPKFKTTAIIVNVWLWPSVRFLHEPGYIVYVSPWRWAHYPVWWRPWNPVRRAVFYAHAAPHRVYYRPAPVRRVVVARKVYAPRRHTSTLVVHNRRGTTVVHENRNGNVKTVKVRKRSTRTRR